MAEVQRLKALIATFDQLIKEAEQQGRKVVIVGYTAHYAVYVHEAKMKLKGKKRPGKNRGKYWDPQGKAQSKFLETPARSLQPELKRVVNEIYANTGDLAKATFAAGLRLQRESMKLVPVDTGNLKNSAFTRFET